MARPAEPIPLFKRFGQLTAMGSLKKWDDLGRLRKADHYVLCVCDCGTAKFVMAASLRSGNTTSCGCAMRAEDRSGERFGKLVVVGRAPQPETQKRKRTSAFWRCKCDCGNESVVEAHSLTTGNTTSCGCAWIAARDANHEKLHGLRGTRVINVWKNMIVRCTDSNSRDWPRYGGRGISVCDRWRFGEDGKHPATCFFEDMGHPPAGHTIDRIDVNGNYEPGNVRWADKRTQANNRRRHRWVKVLGSSMTLAECARQFKVDYETMRRKVVNKGMTAEDALASMGVRIDAAEAVPANA